jgi:integrase
MRGIHRLTPLKVAKLKKPGLYADGGNLYLQVSIGAEDNVRKSWLFRYAQVGKQKLSENGRPYQPTKSIGLGSVNTVGLAEVREKARKYRQMLLDDIDPVGQRDSERAKKRAEAANVITFEAAMQSYMKQHQAAWTLGNRHQFISCLTTYVLPTLGKLSVADIGTPHVLQVLEPIWETKTVTAQRVRSRIESILAWATVSNFRSGPNPATWKNHVDKLLAKPGDIRKVKHVPALPYGQMPSFMQQLQTKVGLPALALQFTVLTCVRTWDVLHAKRSDIDKVKRMWTIQEFSKTGKVQIVPLSDSALEVLEKAEIIATEIGGDVLASDVAFPNDLTGKMLSENSMLAVIKRMNLKGKMTAHGARSAFRTWALECTSFPRELAELCLGHSLGSAVELAYLRSSAVEKRRAIMQAWADFLSKPADAECGNVIPINAKR